MARCFVVSLLAVLSLAVAEDAASTATSSKSHGGAHTGPFSSFTKSLPQEKKKPFMELMKRLRGTKAATVGSKEEKKKVMGSLDSDIHKLLGSEYKRYRTVQHTAHEIHSAAKNGAEAAAAPPPPSPGTKVKAGGKKKATPTSG